jgi:cytochrome b6-f complex iron-sulfur subunit
MTEQEKQDQAELPPTPAEEAASAPAEQAATEAIVSEQRKPVRREAAAAPHGPPTAVVLAQRQPGTPIVSRRRMLLVGFWAGIGAAVAGMAACGLDIIYPSKVTGFGGTVSVPASAVPKPGEKVQIGEGRFWLVNLTAEQGGPGLLALWWKCPHLGCTVPWQPTFVWPDPATGALKSGWFRCPCHGSTYTDAGVRVYGPAPRSMDTMNISVGGNGDLTVDTGARLNGSTTNPDRAVRV